MNVNKIAARISTATGGIVGATCATAAMYWPPALTNWEIIMNNGVAYISSAEMPAGCSHYRAEIRVADSAYNRALLAFAMSAKARDKGLRFVIDDSTSQCVIYALQEI